MPRPRAAAAETRPATRKALGAGSGVGPTRDSSLGFNERNLNADGTVMTLEQIIGEPRRLGLCGTCRDHPVQCYEIVTSGGKLSRVLKGSPKRVPRTEEGVVENGRCLRCRPKRDRASPHSKSNGRQARGAGRTPPSSPSSPSSPAAPAPVPAPATGGAGEQSVRRTRANGNANGNKTSPSTPSSTSGGAERKGRRRQPSGSANIRGSKRGGVAKQHPQQQRGNASVTSAETNDSNKGSETDDDDDDDDDNDKFDAASAAVAVIGVGGASSNRIDVGTMGSIFGSTSTSGSGNANGNREAPPPPSLAQPMHANMQHHARHRLNCANNNRESSYGGEKSSNPYGGGGGRGGTGGRVAANTNRHGRSSSSYKASPTSSGPTMRQLDSNEHQITPIVRRNPCTNQWTIRARVTTKSDVRTWPNAKGESSLLSVKLLDSSGCDIRATFFNDAVDKFFHIIQVDKVYTFSGGELKVANSQYNTCKSQMEITFDQNAEIHLFDDVGDIEQQLRDSCKISDLESSPSVSQLIHGNMSDAAGCGRIVSALERHGNRSSSGEGANTDDNENDENDNDNENENDNEGTVVNVKEKAIAPMFLTTGAVSRIVKLEGHQSDPTFSPIVQIINVKILSKNITENGPDRYRIMISDGQHYVQGMLATQLNSFVESSQIQDNTIVQVKDFLTNIIQGKHVITLLDIDIINSNYASRIGDPQDIDTVATGDGGIDCGVAENTNRYGHSSTSYAASPPSSGPTVMQTDPNGQQITPIASLNLYMNRWTIRARVTTKSDVRTWSNAKGEGSLFSVELLDSSGFDIRATFFKEAVEKFFSMIQVDKVYTFSGGRLKVANAQYNTCKSQMEITFDQNAEIHLANDVGDIQQQLQLYDFRKISDLERLEPGTTVDVIGLVTRVGEVGHVTSKKTQKELTKCELTLIDDTNTEVSLTVWGEQAERAQSQFGGGGGRGTGRVIPLPVVAAFRRAMPSDFGGRNLIKSMNGSTSIEPRIDETERLKSGWRTVGPASFGPSAVWSISSGGGGGVVRVTPFHERKAISSIKEENMGHNSVNGKPDWLSFKGTFTFLKKDREGGAWYTACSNAGEPCKNRPKIQQTPDGHWKCKRCNTTSPNCVRRWIFSAMVADDSSTTWVSIFNNQAETMFGGATADEIYARCMNPKRGIDEDYYASVFDRANFCDYVFTCKVEQESVGNEMLVKPRVTSLVPLDYVKESRYLLAAIAKM